MAKCRPLTAPCGWQDHYSEHSCLNIFTSITLKEPSAAERNQLMSLRCLRHLLLWYFFSLCLLRGCPFKSHPAHPVGAQTGPASSCCSKTCQNVLVPNFCPSRCQHGAWSLPSFHLCAEVSSDWSLCSLCFQPKLTFSFFSFLLISSKREASMLYKLFLSCFASPHLLFKHQ